MQQFDREGRIARTGRALVCCLLLLTLLGTPGVVAGNSESTAESECPSVANERGSDHAPTVAFEESADGRSTALIASGCVESGGLALG